MAGFNATSFITSARTKGLTYSPTNVGIEQEYWQSLSYLPSTAQAGSDKIKARKQDGKAQAMPKLGESRYARGDPSLLANNK